MKKNIKTVHVWLVVLLSFFPTVCLELKNEISSVWSLKKMVTNPRSLSVTKSGQNHRKAMSLPQKKAHIVMPLQCTWGGTQN